MEVLMKTEITNNKITQGKRLSHGKPGRIINLIATVFIVSLVCATINAFAYITLTQTTTADFNKGYHDNVVASGDNVYLPDKASNVGNWFTTTNLPQALAGHQTATWRSYVYLSGGYTGSSYSSSVYRATLQGSGISSWSGLNSLPVPLRNHAFVVSIDYVYVFGGRTDGAPSDEIYYASLNSDGSIGTWQLSSNTLPAGLWGHTAFFSNGYIYIVGGTDQAGENTAVSTVYYAKVGPYGDISAFTATNSLPGARNGHTMFFYGGNFHVLGGYDNSGTRQNTVFYTSLNADGSCSVWQTATNTLPEAISNHSSTCYNGLVSIIGGDNGSYSNKVYYADADDAPEFNWNLSTYTLYDPRKSGRAFASNGQIIFAGGEYLTGSPIANTRYTPLTMTGNKVGEGSFVSYPFHLETELDFDNLTYNLTYNGGFSNYEIFYRTAGNDEIWGNWTSGGQTNPVIVGEHKRYLQYMFTFSTTGNYNVTLHDLSAIISGFTEISGNLNSIDTLKLENSPYWVSGNISFTAGTHVIDPGVIIVFTNNTGFEIGQTNLICNGTVSDSILFTYHTEDAGLWNGIYFNDVSDNGVISEMSYTIVEKAGYGSRNSNLYCYATNMPYITNSTFREAVGHGVRLNSSDLIIEYSLMKDNTESGLHLNNSNSSLQYVDLSGNDYAGVYYNNTASSLTSFGCNLENNFYGIYYPTPNSNFPLANNNFNFINNTGDFAIAGGDISNNRTWGYFDGGYVLLGNVFIRKDNSVSRLTIAPGNTIYLNNNVYIQIGYYQTGYPYHNFGGELYAEGTADSTIIFTAFNDSVGGWYGMYYHDNSDWSGSTSSMKHCIIEKANNYNIYCGSTTQPLLEDCIIRESASEGLQLGSSPITVKRCTIEDNHTGLYTSSSSASIDSVLIQNNTNTGIRCAGSPAYISNSEVLNNNVYEIYADDPNGYPGFTNSTITGNGSTVTIAGSGMMISNRDWIYFNGDYHILGDMTIAKDNSVCRLTVAPANTLKFGAGVDVQVGYYQTGYPYHSFGGELYAVGTADNIITFTALNDSSGGWNGLYYHDMSDWSGSTSLFSYCKIEKGNSYNFYCNSTTQPSIDNSTISGASNEGFELYSSPISISNSIIEENRTGIYSDNSLVSISNSQVKNNTVYEIYAANPNGYPNFTNSTIWTNYTSKVIIGAGTQSVDRTWLYYNGIYKIIGNVLVAKDQSKCRLTIERGNVLKFDEGIYLQIGYYQTGYPYHHFGGELYAEGIADSTITFTAFNDSIGGWHGIYFHDDSDNYGSLSSMKNCIIEKTSNYGVYCSSTSQPTIEDCLFTLNDEEGLQLMSSSNLVKRCTITNNHTGLYMSSSSASLDSILIQNNTNTGIRCAGSPSYISNSEVLNNNVYEIYADDPNGYPGFTNSTITGNGSTITIGGGGMVTSNRTWIYFNGDYNILGDMTIAKDNSVCRLTIAPDNTLKFGAGVDVQVGYYQTGYPYHNFGGELYAEGTAEGVIKFTALNDSTGGWDGIYFHDNSDWSGSTSSFKNCIIEKGNSYNIYCNSTTQPAIIDSCIISYSANYGLNLNNSTIQLKRTQIIENNSSGIYINGSGSPVIGNTANNKCELFRNGTYDVYNNTGNNINARYNFWNSTDSAFIAHRIYDYYDNAGKGIVYFYPFSLFGTNPLDTFSLSGNIRYKNADSTILDNITVYANYIDGNPQDSTDTDVNGDYLYTALTNGFYSFSMVTSKPWGGVNATHALAIMQHFAHINLLSGLYKKVADVNGSNTINGTDALFVMKRYTQIINSFPVGDWLLENDTILIDHDTVRDFRALVYGDVLGWYIPPGGKKSGLVNELSINYEGFINILPGDVVEVPFYVNKNMDIGAVSLDLGYPEEYIEITDVKIQSDKGQLIFNPEDGHLKIAWCSLNPLQLNENDLLISVFLKVTDEYKPGDKIGFTISGPGELADMELNAFKDVKLTTPYLNHLSEFSEPSLSQNFPNPFSHKTDIEFILPEEGFVKLTVYNNCGEEITVLVNNRLSAGKYKEEFDGSDFSPGLYFYVLEVKGMSTDFSEVRKMIISK